MTQNKVHHLLAILYLTFEVNITQVSYVIECVIVNGVQFTEVWFLKGLFERNIPNCAVICKLRNLKYLSRFCSYKFFLISKRCQNSFNVWKLHQVRKKLKSDKTISNRPATARFEIFLIHKLFAMFFCIHKMGMINMHFLVKVIFILYKNSKFHLKSRSEKTHCAIWNIGSRMPRLDIFLVMQ